MKLRQLMQFGAAVVAAAAFVQSAWAQTYPSRPVRVIVGFPAGGLSDIIGRLIGQRMAEQLGQPFLVENRPGAVTNIATESVINAPADGYTLLLSTAVNAINASVYEKLNFNFIRDTAPVAAIVDAAFVMEVHPSIPAKTVPEFIAYAKTRSGKINMASGGTGGPEHVAGELFKMMAGVDMFHVPYKGSGPAVTDLVGGQVQVYFGPIAPSIEYIKAGRLRALAVTTAQRSPALPDTPTLAEFLPGFEMSAWQGLSAPKQTPVEIVEKLNRAVNKALADTEVKARLAALGTTPLPGSPADFAKLIAADTEKWAKVVKTAGIKAE
jgi:tripartite-type tricarboxylate transporter receptor subunit TctC